MEYEWFWFFGFRLWFFKDAGLKFSRIFESGLSKDLDYWLFMNVGWVVIFFKGFRFFSGFELLYQR